MKVLQLPKTKKTKFSVASQTFATIMASEEGDNGSPSLADVWKVLTEIKTNTEKLVLEVNS